MAENRKSRAWLALQAWLLLGAAATFAVSVQSMALPVVAGLLLAASLFIRRALPHTVRAWVWTLVGCAGFCLALASPEPSDAVRFTLMASHRWCPVLIGIGIAMTFFEQRAASLGAQATCALIAVILAGGNEAEGLDLAAVRRVQACLMASMLLPMGMLIRRAATGVPAPGAASGAAGRWVSGRTPAVAVTLLLAAGLFVLVQARLFGWSDSFGFFMNEWLQNAAGRRAGRQTPVADIRTPPPAARRGRQAVAIRVWSDRMPGYLRAIAYPTYGRGVWRAARATQAMPESGESWEGAPARLFVRPDGAGLAGSQQILVAWRMQAAGAFDGVYLPLPGRAEQVAIVADNAWCDPDGSVRAEGWIPSSGYRAYLPSTGPGSSHARQLQLKEMTRDDTAFADPYLVVPAGVVSGLQQRLAEWQVPEAGAPAAAIIEAVKRGLQTNLTYRLGVKLGPGIDPVLQFLDGGQGHCELFASAAALMLRQRGVRTRYVTGYLCEEPHPSRRYWVARVMDAHAWVEAYVPEDSRWALVDATPPGVLPSGKGRFGFWGGRADLVRAALRQAWGGLRSGAAVQGLRQGVAWVAIALLDHAVAVLLAVAVLASAWFAWRIASDRRSTPAWLRRLNAVRRRVDRRLAAAGHTRPPHETLREGVTRATGLAPEERQALLSDVDAWERGRYGQQTTPRQPARRRSAG